MERWITEIIHAVLRPKRLLRLAAFLALLGVAFAAPAWASEPGQIGTYDTNVSHGQSDFANYPQCQATATLRSMDGQAVM